MRDSDYTVKGYSLGEIRNNNEKGVCRMMEKIVDREEFSGMCLCGVCLEDIYGLALNRLAPKYKHSRTILLKSKGKNTDMEAAILEAIDIVKNAPKHN